ncbi:MAG: FAD binding domain-containing protein [Desulfobacterales bacterium]|nr:FAD binding domain-containing protein [Desulfobacterales bacterium]
MNKTIEYIRPADINEAVNFLDLNGNNTVTIAGGTDVMIDLRSGEISPEYLLDISRLPDIHGIGMKDGLLHIGAGSTINIIARSQDVYRFAPSLTKATETFAVPQIRNMATIGGNVAHCSPCGDTVPSLLVHEAYAVVHSISGVKHIPVSDIASGPYLTNIKKNELISSFVLKPVTDSQFSNFEKIGRRKALAISRMNMAVILSKSNNGTVDFIRFALGAATPVSKRIEEIENFLIGQKPVEKILWQAGKKLADIMVAISGRRPSTIYKEKAVQGLFLRLLHPVINCK